MRPMKTVVEKTGVALGAGTTLIGPEAAMACTAAVETEIDKHYSDQLDQLEATNEDPELAAMIEEFREDEREHRGDGDETREVVAHVRWTFGISRRFPCRTTRSRTRPGRTGSGRSPARRHRRA